MSAAKWVAHAEDITSQQDRWNNYLSVDQFADRIGLEQATIRDSLHRTYSPDDPRSVVSRPAARIGAGRVGHLPMWAPEQVDRVKELQARRTQTQRGAHAAELPTVSAAHAAERGLVSMEELVEATDVPKSTISKWIRQHSAAHPTMPFPPKRAIAERVPPMQMGPPRPLYDLDEVQTWIRRYRAALDTRASA